ncbi:RluA family pseudouridine synthase [Candidatus Peregrinibacteria bacterium]|nr:RluA family pseudouridine synthase [Candidatus Peregrinibacteria bacterium]
MFAEKRKYVVSSELAGLRADLALSKLENEVSRQYLQKMFKEKRVWLGGKYLKPSFKVAEGDQLMIDYPKALSMDLEPVKLPLKVVYEDKYILVINKDPGVVVHPAEQGKFMGKSLVNAALAHVGEGLKGIGGVLRPGIVHRLDKDTSGLIVIAKTDKAHQELVNSFKSREVDKSYLALIYGELKEKKGLIVASIGRSPRDRKKMAIDGINAKEAKTEYKVVKKYDFGGQKFSLVDIKLHTGRTHQIRVHFESIGHPLIGDKHYGRDRINAKFKEIGLERQFLHAYRLKFNHPISKKKIDLKIDLSDDLQKVLDLI